MVRTIITFVISALVLITATLWAINSQLVGNMQEILLWGGLLIVVGFAVFIGIQRARSVARKEPVEDELSRKLLVKASSLSFYISLYFWLFIMYISDKTEMEAHSLIGAGIMGMAIVFFLSWAALKIFGLRK